jgi:hypothetical protein
VTCKVHTVQSHAGKASLFHPHFNRLVEPIGTTEQNWTCSVFL